MPTTLLGFLRANVPELGGRVYLSTAPGVPDSPYAICWSKPGGRAQPFYGASNLMTAIPCVTFYAKPGTGETAQQAELLLMSLATKATQAVYNVDTHNDGVTPYRPGSLQLQADFAPMPDAQVQGQSYLTVQFTALIWRE